MADHLLSPKPHKWERDREEAERRGQGAKVWEEAAPLRADDSRFRDCLFTVKNQWAHRFASASRMLENVCQNDRRSIHTDRWFVVSSSGRPRLMLLFLCCFFRLPRPTAVFKQQQNRRRQDRPDHHRLTPSLT